MNTGDSTNAARRVVRGEVASIDPFDAIERDTQAETLRWLDSNAPLFRTHKPATPPKHLVSYFVLVDSDHVLLVDHINAGLWLPTGGHVEPGEHPQDTVRREVQEELGIEASFLRQQPFFISTAKTVGATAGHTDVSLWYLLKGDRQGQLKYDASEFSAVAWYSRSTLPWARTDPHMERFLSKLENCDVQDEIQHATDPAGESATERSRMGVIEPTTDHANRNTHR